MDNLEKILQGYRKVSSGIPTYGVWYYQGIIYTPEHPTCKARLGKDKAETLTDAMTMIKWSVQGAENPSEELLFPLDVRMIEELENRIETNDYPITYIQRLQAGNKV